MHVRRVRNLYYTKEFAEVLFRETLLQNAKISVIWNRLHVRAYEKGNELGRLHPAHTRFWLPLIEDIFHSKACADFQRRLLKQDHEHQEMNYISIDGTMRCTFCGDGSSFI